MLFEKNPNLNVLGCQTCGSTGYVGFKTCSECKGMSMGRVMGEDFLYFGEPLTRYHIKVERARRISEKLKIIGAIIFTIGFWSLFAWIVYKKVLFEYLFDLEFWFENGIIEKSLFWLGVLSMTYLMYRLASMNKPPEEIEQRTRKEIEEILEQAPAVISDWTQLKKISRKHKLNIAKRFTKDARKVLEDAYLVADKYNSPHLESVHIFYALLSSIDIANIFIRLGVPVKSLQTKLSKQFKVAKQETIPLVSADVINILFNAYDLAFSFKDNHVRVAEILVATVRQSESLQELLYDLEIDSQKLSNVIEWVRIKEKLREQYFKFRRAASHRSKHGMDRAMTAIATPFLNKYSQDLTLMAKYGHLTTCVARDKEIEEVFRIIEGGRQSIILSGEQGVGKMTIVEGIVGRMIEDDTPAKLKDKRLVQISTSALLAGTTVSGAQERLLKIMNEVGRAKNIILFIKNIHDLMGVANAQGESLDVSETLAEYLGPGKFLLFATTEPEEYNQHILHSQLGQVLSRVEVKEMDTNQAIQVLESKAGSMEYKHQIFFSYNAIEACVVYAERFLHEQNLPESGISLMAEVASFVRNKRGTNQLVSKDDVGQIISKKTGIPTASISEDESEKLMRLEEEMHKRVIGQDQAVILVANALRRARADIRSRKRPIANFLFLGPTGVGKTELAKTIASVYFGGENQMIRVDMSEYQDKSSIYRLIGQPGQQGTGLLTEAIRQKPFSLILLDEMEKAEPDVLNLFLQVFDDGRLTDSTGHVIDFTNSIIIATSNAGTNYVQEQLSQGIELSTIREQMIRGELKKYYRPEFLNRFDGIVLFKPLEREEIKKIAGLMIKGIGKNLENRGVELRVEESALEALAQVGFDPEFGARPMRRAIQEYVEDKLAELVLQGKLKRRDVVVLGEGVKITILRSEATRNLS